MHYHQEAKYEQQTEEKRNSFAFSSCELWQSAVYVLCNRDHDDTLIRHLFRSENDGYLDESKRNHAGCLW